MSSPERKGNEDKATDKLTDTNDNGGVEITVGDNNLHDKRPAYSDENTKRTENEFRVSSEETSDTHVILSPTRRIRITA